MDFDTVVHNGIVVTVDNDNRTIPHGWIGIAGGRIQAIETGCPPMGANDVATSIDASGGIIMPGLINIHTHLPMTLFRGLADDLPLMTWLNDHIFPVESRFINPETVRWGALLAGAEMLLSGTTCCCGGYFHEDAVAQAAADIGIRAVLAQGVLDFPAPGVPDPEDNVAHARVYANRWQKRNGLITPSIFCHSPYTCSDNTLKAAKAAAVELGLVFQIHVAETCFERDQSLKEKGVSPVAYLDRLGILDRQTLMSHCVWVDDGDIDIIAGRGCAVAHCPESNMKLASGIAPVVAMQEAGIVVGLGTDGCASNNDLDLFAEMDTTAKLHKLATGDPTAMGAPNVLGMATVNGARALDLADEIGSLEIGKQADMIVLDTCMPHLTPMYRPESHIVYTAGGAAVRDVLIAGQPVVKDRKLMTVDVDEVISRVNEIGLEIESDVNT